MLFQIGHTTRISVRNDFKRTRKSSQIKDERAFFRADNLFHEACFEIAGRKEVWNWLDDHNTHLERFRWLRVTIQGLHGKRSWNNMKIYSEH